MELQKKGGNDKWYRLSRTSIAAGALSLLVRVYNHTNQWRQRWKSICFTADSGRWRFSEHPNLEKWQKSIFFSQLLDCFTIQLSCIWSRKNKPFIYSRQRFHVNLPQPYIEMYITPTDPVKFPVCIGGRISMYIFRGSTMLSLYVNYIVLNLNWAP